ncbi:MAG: aldehyde dehydrogenase family protein [Planctomycetota bacterium]
MRALGPARRRAANPPALAAGCAVVVHPSPRASLGVLRLARLMADAGLPDGVLNVVTGTGRTAAVLAGHRHVALVAFSGSPEAGRDCRRAAAPSGARVLADTGGRGPDVLLDDAPLEDAVDEVVHALGAPPAPACGLGSTLLVQEGLEADLCRWLHHRLARLRVGDPLDPDTELGPVPDPGRFEDIQAFLALARDDGVEVVEPGFDGQDGADGSGRLEAALPGSGRWCRPGYVTGVVEGMAVAGTTIPGPLFVVRGFRTPAEALERARSIEPGRPASVWTANGSRLPAMLKGLDRAVAHGNCTMRHDAGGAWSGGPQGLWPYLE